MIEAILKACPDFRNNGRVKTLFATPGLARFAGSIPERDTLDGRVREVLYLLSGKATSDNVSAVSALLHEVAARHPFLASEALVAAREEQERWTRKRVSILVNRLRLRSKLAIPYNSGSPFDEREHEALRLIIGAKSEVVSGLLGYMARSDALMARDDWRDTAREIAASPLVARDEAALEVIELTASQEAVSLHNMEDNMDPLTMTKQQVVSEYVRVDGLISAHEHLNFEVPKSLTTRRDALVRRAQAIARAEVEAALATAKAQAAALQTRAQKRQEAQDTVAALEKRLAKM